MSNTNKPTTKAALVTITIGIHRGKKAKIVKRKGTPENHVTVNIVDGPIIHIHKSLIK